MNPSIMGARVDHSGERHDHLKLLRRVEDGKHHAQMYECRCFCGCGSTTVTRYGDMRKGDSKSCGDMITARFLYGEHFEFVPQFKLWLGTNHKPKIVGANDGIWRRIRLIPFTVQIPKERQDKNLPKKLKVEAVGILNWALEGLRQWQQMGLAEPNTVTDATSEYRADQDVLQHFVDARCKTGASQRVKGSALYASYKQWAEIAGEFIMSERDFGNAMSDRGYTRYHTKSERGWDGIALTAEDETVDETLEDSSELAEALD